MTPSVSDAAEAELVSAAQTYAESGGKDLGAAFIDEFERCLDLLCERPYLGMIWENPMRRFPLRRFPYSIVYRIEGDLILVIALAHQRRRPGYWQRKDRS